jgi:hypothetical protein
MKPRGSASQSSSDRLLNDYGDVLIQVPGGLGGEIAIQRFDELDRKCLAFALGEQGGGAVDLGSGQALQPVRLALADMETWAFDLQDLGARYDELVKLLPGAKLRFFRKDLRALEASDLPDDLRLVYSQRTLHYLRFQESVQLLRTLVPRLVGGARCFLSVSGLHSELGQGYAASVNDLASRFGYLAPEIKKRHGIEEEVCLYSQDDLERLGTASNLKVERIWLSAFGNVKGIFTVD